MNKLLSVHRFVSIALVCVLLLALCAPSLAVGAVPANGSLFGYVTDGDGQPVEGAQIELFRASDGKYVTTGWSRTAGYYQFSSDPDDQPTQYRMKVSVAPSYGLRVYESPSFTIGANVPSVEMNVQLSWGAELAADSYENDEFNPQHITVGGAAQQRTLYPAADVDRAVIDVIAGRTYLIETSPREYYTDTELSLYDSSEAEYEIKYNDDKDYPNRDLYSRVKWTAIESGQLYIEVRERNEEAIGDYQLRVVEFRPPATQLQTLAGADRYATALKASHAAFEAADSVVVATGESFADALGGASLAGVVEGPMLLTRKDRLPDGLAGEIQRLGAEKVYILGGTGAVSPAAEAALRKVPGVVQIERLAGRSRYDTALVIAQKVIALQGQAYGGGVFVATGANFPDALGASPLAARTGFPILLANPNSSTIALPPQADVAIVCGGEGAVSRSIERTLEQRLGVDNVMRFDGEDRFETAAYVAEMGVLMFGMTWDGVGVTTGMNYPDALSAGPALSAMNTVMLLTRPYQLPLVSAICLSYYRDDIERIHIFGGATAVSSPVAVSMRSLLH